MGGSPRSDSGEYGSALPRDHTPPTAVDPNANITATFSEPMKSKSFQISNHSTFTTSSKTFYLLRGNFTAASTTLPYKNPPRFCTTLTTACPDPIPATVSYNAVTNTATLNPYGSSTTGLVRNTTYTAVVEGTADGDFVSVKDADGTPMATDYIFHFTTAP